MATAQPTAHKRVTHLWEAFAVRRIRNECCDYLTNHRERIGMWRQIEWYWRFYRAANASSLYRLYLLKGEQGQAVGYGALQLREDKLYITECVGKGHRGKGYGRAVLDNLICIGRAEKRELIAEIWESNQRSVAMHIKAGFVGTGRRNQEGQALLILSHMV